MSAAPGPGSVRPSSSERIGQQAAVGSGERPPASVVGLAPLGGGDDERKRPAAVLTGQLDLAGPPATGTSQGLI